MIRPQDFLTHHERRVLFYLAAVLFLGLLVHNLGIAAQEEEFDESKLDTLLVEKQLVDIRTADRNELESLPRIGPKLAERIICYREQTQFVNTIDLIKVKGIGQKTFDRLSPFLVRFGTSQSLVAADSIELGSDDLIDINKADHAQLMSLNGIGKVKAQRIIDKRSELGKFRSVDELLSVKGIGEKTLAKIKPYIKCER